MNSGSVYKDIFYGIKNLSGNSENLEGLKIEKNFSKRVKDEFLVIKFFKEEYNQEYDIRIMIWRKIFFSCHLIRVSGHVNNEYFEIFFKVDMEDNKWKIRFYDFAEKCPMLQETGHKIFESNGNNLGKRNMIYKDTKNILKKLENLIVKVLSKKNEQTQSKPVNNTNNKNRNIKNVSVNEKKETFSLL